MAVIDPTQASAVQDYYRRYLGREAGANDPQSWLTGAFGYGTDLGSIENAIKNSDEARAYRQRSQPAAPQPPAPTSQPSAQPPSAPPPQPPSGQTPNYWDPSVFSQIVGRAPNDAETAYYSMNPNWYTEVEHNTPNYHESAPWDPTQFQQVTGRAPTATETAYYSRRGNSWLDEVKRNTPGYTQGPSATRPSGGNINDPTYLRQLINWAATQPGVNPSVINDPNYWMSAAPRFNGDENYFIQRMFTPEGAPEGGRGWGGTSVFSDPATKQYEDLLNSLIGKFSQGYTPPGYQTAIDQLNKYLAQLNGPAYTPEQQATLQTQALDPLERQRSAQKQQVIERLASRGIMPSSGIVEQALQNTDNSFNTIRANTQAGLASNQIGVQRQNAATAAQLAPQIAQMEAGNYATNMGYGLQAAQLASLIPQLAWSRLQGANSAVSPISPAALFGLQNQYQQYGYGQNADYMNSLMQLIAQLFGSGGFGG